MKTADLWDRVREAIEACAEVMFSVEEAKALLDERTRAEAPKTKRGAK